METKKLTAASIAVAAALSGGAVGRLSAPQPSMAAHPVALRWLNEGPGKPNRYALGILGTIEGGEFAVEIVCESDGSEPKLNGRPFEHGKAVCETVSRTGASLNLLVGEMARELSRPIK